ncbi:hypothetical protein D3C81_1969860 [compost metagenome]
MRRHTQGLSELHQFHGVDASLPALALGDEGLRISQALGQLDLRHAHPLTGRLQDGQ